MKNNKSVKNFQKKSKKFTPGFPKNYYTNRNVKTIRKLEYYFDPLTKA